MANRIDNIFSDGNYNIDGKLRFESPEAYKKFLAALELVQSEGKVVPVDGISSFSTAIRYQNTLFPLDSGENITNFVIGPSYDYTNIKVLVGGEEKEIRFKYHQIKDSIIMETTKDSIVEIKQIYNFKDERLNLTYSVHYDRASTIQEVVDSLCLAEAFLSRLVKKEIQEIPEPENLNISKIKNYFRYATAFFKRVLTLEETLEIDFLPSEIRNMTEDDQRELDELYLLLCEKKTLRMNQKFKPSHISLIPDKKQKNKLEVGNLISLTFRQSYDYKLLGVEFTIYTTNIIFDAIAKEVHEESDEIKVIYGGTDSRPMYISYRAFITPEEAEKEVEQLDCNEESYKFASMSYKYIKEWY